MTHALELAKKIQSGQVSCKAVLDQCFAKVEAEDTQVNAFISLSKDVAYAKADEIDALVQKGNPLPSALAGVPLIVKDNINLKGTRTTCGSKMLKNYQSVYTATATTKCLDAGLLPIGKANLDEFAMGSSTENSAFFASRNPWDTAYVPGGSSGGSAAGVAAGFAPLALGSDTGGSIRQPAAYCSLVGLKPTYGRVSRFGLVAFASSLDQIGPITQTVEECAHFLNVVSGHDPHDSTSASQPVPDFTQSLNQDVSGLRIGVPRVFLEQPSHPGVLASLENAIDVFKKEGATIEVIDLDCLRHGVDTYYILAPAEASANLARFDGVRYGYRDTQAKSLKEMIKASRGYGFGKEVKRRIILGTFVLSAGYYDAYYTKAQKVRAFIKDEFAKAFSSLDAILLPTAPETAFRFGEFSRDPLKMYLKDICTIPANLAGLPAISFQGGFSDGMPVGLQLMSKHWDEGTLLRLSHRFQQVTDFHTQLSPFAKGVQS